MLCATSRNFWRLKRAHVRMGNKANREKWVNTQFEKLIQDKIKAGRHPREFEYTPPGKETAVRFLVCTQRFST